MTKLVAYHNDQSIKDGLLASLKAHAKADAVIHGTYWDNGKGCAIGCTLESLGHDNHADHMAYETRLGIPVMLARLEDVIFEGLTNGKAKEWPRKFSQAIKPGADLSLVGWKFQHWILTKSGLLDAGGNEQVISAIKQVADVIAPLTKGLPVDKDAAESAMYAADAAMSAAGSAADAADAAWSAAGSAANAADAAWSAGSAMYAGYAAKSAADAGYAAKSAAKSGADAAWSAWSAGSAYGRMAEKLLRLLRAAK